MKWKSTIVTVSGRLRREFIPSSVLKTSWWLGLFSNALGTFPFWFQQFQRTQPHNDAQQYVLWMCFTLQWIHSGRSEEAYSTSPFNLRILRLQRIASDAWWNKCRIMRKVATWWSSNGLASPSTDLRLCVLYCVRLSMQRIVNSASGKYFL